MEGVIEQLAREDESFGDVVFNLFGFLLDVARSQSRGLSLVLGGEA